MSQAPCICAHLPWSVFLRIGRYQRVDRLNAKQPVERLVPLLNDALGSMLPLGWNAIDSLAANAQISLDQIDICKRQRAPVRARHEAREVDRAAINLVLSETPVDRAISVRPVLDERALPQQWPCQHGVGALSEPAYFACQICRVALLVMAHHLRAAQRPPENEQSLGSPRRVDQALLI